MKKNKLIREKRKPKDFGITCEVKKKMQRWKKKLNLNIWDLKYLKLRKML